MLHSEIFHKMCLHEGSVKSFVQRQINQIELWPDLTGSCGS